MEKKFYKGVLVGDDEVEVNLLQYMDDTIFLGETSLSNV